MYFLDFFKFIEDNSYPVFFMVLILSSNTKIKRAKTLGILGYLSDLDESQQYQLGI